MSVVPFPPMKRPLVAILRGVRPEEAADIVSVLIDSGMTAIEIPLNSPDPFRSIEIAVKKAPAGILVGAGTVLTLEAVERLHDVGGRLLVTPNVDPDIIARARARGMVTMPGVFTPTEALLAAKTGASSLKFFPASVLGAAGITAIRAVLPADLMIAAVGGVSDKNFADYTGRHSCIRPRQQPLQARHDGGGSRRSRQGDDRRVRYGHSTGGVDRRYRIRTFSDGTLLCLRPGTAAGPSAPPPSAAEHRDDFFCARNRRTIPGIDATLGNYAFFVDPMILEFVLGVIAASIFVNGRVSWPISVAAACAITAVLVTDPANRVIVSGIPSACLVAAAAFVSRKRINPSWLERALARLGDASYSIYLAQVQTVSLASTSIASLIPVVPSLLLVIVTSGIVVALGLLLNILAEPCSTRRPPCPLHDVGLERLHD